MPFLAGMHPPHEVFGRPRILEGSLPDGEGYGTGAVFVPASERAGCGPLAEWWMGASQFGEEGVIR